MAPEEFTDYLHRHIPLTAAVDARVLRSDENEIAVAAPLGPNLNHRNTAFGGSLATLGIIAGWALLHASLRREGLRPKIVIQNSQCEFIEPATSDLLAVSQLPREEWPRFLKTLRRHHRARMAVDTVVSSDGKTVVNHRGVFVAIDAAGAEE